MTGPEFVREVRTALLAGVQPPDPETVEELDAAVAAFPEQRWRWQAAPEIAEVLLGELPAPMDEDDQAKLVSTLLDRADVFGPIVRMLAASSGDSDAV